MSRSNFQYAVTISSDDGRSLACRHADHDDFLAITHRLRSGMGLEADDAAAPAVGLKLLAAVTLKRRFQPPFADLRPVLASFSRALKAQAAAVSQANAPLLISRDDRS